MDNYYFQATESINHVGPLLFYIKKDDQRNNYVPLIVFTLFSSHID